MEGDDPSTYALATHRSTVELHPQNLIEVYAILVDDRQTLLFNMPFCLRSPPLTEWALILVDENQFAASEAGLGRQHDTFAGIAI
jgi:hypothetical protein